MSITAPARWLQIERHQSILVLGRDAAGVFIAIYAVTTPGDNADVISMQHELARFNTSLAELTGLFKLWKKADRR